MQPNEAIQHKGVATAEPTESTPLEQLSGSLGRAFDAVDRLEEMVTQIIDGPPTQGQGKPDREGFGSVMSGLRHTPDALGSIQQRIDDQVDRLRQALLEP